MTKGEATNTFDGEIPYDILIIILFDIQKYFDKEFTELVHKYQVSNHRILNASERKQLRRYFYYGHNDDLQGLTIDSFNTIHYTKSDEECALNDFASRIEEYNSNHIIESIKQRYKNLKSNFSPNSNANKWLKYYENKREKYRWSGLLLKISNIMFRENGFNYDFIFSVISSTYDMLENYRYFFVEITEPILNKNNCDITWELINQTIIYAENFKLFTDKFFAFKKEKQVSTLSDFIAERFSTPNSRQLAEKFYTGISTGFVYEDCLVSTNSKHILLVLRKIKLDNSPIPCPSCLTTIQSGNSYPKLFLKSYECKNPSCPERSKSGRGKRFDEYGTYRYFKFVENRSVNRIDKELYLKWQRDIFDDANDIYEMILKFYLWDNEKLGVIGDVEFNCDLHDRIIDKIENTTTIFNSNHTQYCDLPIVSLINELSTYLIEKPKNIRLENDLEIINGDSTEIVDSLCKDQVCAAITSPPYYNAREYSSWPNFVLYLIDMMRNGYSVYNALDDKGTYLYNVGDIVGNDNVFINSNMSNRRIPLGAYTSLIFETIGFKIVGNIIWDKGQVQSKRHSTINLYSGYVGFVNCYEHVLVCTKNTTPNIVFSKVVHIPPVIKITCKGENIKIHTAPYPVDLVELIKPFIKKDKYVLDPFLGSGTTLVWCKQNGIKGVGIELKQKYYKLSHKNVFEMKVLH